MNETQIYVHEYHFYQKVFRRSHGFKDEAFFQKSTNSVIEWPSMRKQVLRGLLTYVRLFDVVE